MAMFASISSDPATIAAWLVAGLAFGWLAGKLTQEPSYGVMGDLILGLIGGLLGGLVYGIMKDDAGFFGGVLIALAGAFALVVGGRTVLALRGQ